MPKRLKRKRPPKVSNLGKPPGTLTIDPNALKSQVSVLAYGPDDFVEEDVEDVKHLQKYLEKWPVTWVNIVGLGTEDVISGIGKIFNLHRLALEDVVATGQREKVEYFSDYLFLVTKMIVLNERLDVEQVSIFLGSNFVLTFQERPGDCFEPVRERLRRRMGRIRDAGADYLAYSLQDSIIDSRFPVLEEIGERLEALEDEVIRRPTTETIAGIHKIKRDMLALRRSLWPQRETMSSLLREQNPLITEETLPYLRDIYDHVTQIIDMVETYRELTTGLLDTYISNLSNRTNDIMKVLTIIATIFIPLSFIAGVYGMNFDPAASPMNMPELQWYFGYPFALGLMAAVAIGLLYFFYRKGWIGPGASDDGFDDDESIQNERNA